MSGAAGAVRLPDRCGSKSGNSQHKAHAAALHELSDSLTAATNYVASALRLSQLASTDVTNAAEQTKVLGKALKQLDRAGAVVSSLGKLLREQEP